MVDKREQILERLQAVAGSVSGVVMGTERNQVEFDDIDMPAVSVLEGDEEWSDSDLDRGRPALRPYIVDMMPPVFIRVRQDDTKVGTKLNTIRAAIIKAVLQDSTLLALTKDQRSIRPVSQQSSLFPGRSMIGATTIVFAITYVLNPSDL